MNVNNMGIFDDAEWQKKLNALFPLGDDELIYVTLTVFDSGSEKLYNVVSVNKKNDAKQVDSMLYSKISIPLNAEDIVVQLKNLLRSKSSFKNGDNIGLTLKKQGGVLHIVNIANTNIVAGRSLGKPFFTEKTTQPIPDDTNNMSPDADLPIPPSLGLPVILPPAAGTLDPLKQGAAQLQKEKKVSPLVTEEQLRQAASTKSPTTTILNQPYGQEQSKARPSSAASSRPIVSQQTPALLRSESVGNLLNGRQTPQSTGKSYLDAVRQKPNWRPTGQSNYPLTGKRVEMPVSNRPAGLPTVRPAWGGAKKTKKRNHTKRKHTVRSRK